MSSPRRITIHTSPLRSEARNVNPGVKIQEYAGYFYFLTTQPSGLPGYYFSAGNLIRGSYIYASDTTIYVRARVIDLAKVYPNNIVSEEPDIYRLEPGTLRDFSLPPSGATAGPMPNKDWTLQLQLLGYV